MNTIIGTLYSTWELQNLLLILGLEAPGLSSPSVWQKQGVRNSDAPLFGLHLECILLSV